MRTRNHGHRIIGTVHATRDSLNEGPNLSEDLPGIGTGTQGETLDDGRQVVATYKADSTCSYEVERGENGEIRIVRVPMAKPVQDSINIQAQNMPAALRQLNEANRRRYASK